METLKILAFGASDSSRSINRKLAIYTAKYIQNSHIETINLDDYLMPIYGIDNEEYYGIPDEAHSFLGKVQHADAIVLSLAEHNGSYTVAFKNILDWASRIDREVFAKKPMMLLAASEGSRGGANVLQTALKTLPFLGADIRYSLSFPSFSENFNVKDERITNKEISIELHKMILGFSEEIVHSKLSKITPKL